MRVLSERHEVTPGAEGVLRVPKGLYDASLAVEGGSVVLERMDGKAALYVADVAPPGLVLKIEGGVYRLRCAGSEPVQVWSRIWWRSEPDGTCPCTWMEGDPLPM
jgi:hypothetical protein